MTANVSSLKFLDSNIWIYAFAQNQDPKKRESAIKLIQSSGVVVSTQVINEVCVNLIKKSQFSEPQVTELISAFYAGCQVIPFSSKILRQASELRRRYSLSYWDSLIVSSAFDAPAPILYTEDLQHELIIDAQVQILNPFMT